MRHLETCMIAVRAIPAENVHLESALERFQIIDMRAHHRPKQFDMAFQRFSLGYRRGIRPHVSRIAPGGSRLSAITLAVPLSWLHAEPLADFLKRHILTANT